MQCYYSKTKGRREEREREKEREREERESSRRGKGIINKFNKKISKNCYLKLLNFNTYISLYPVYSPRVYPDHFSFILCKLINRNLIPL